MENQEKITLRSVLNECLEYERGLWKLCSKKYDTLEPMRGMDEDWEAQRKKVDLLEKLIQAYESRPVMEAIADWQKQIMAEDAAGKPHGLNI